tara:strand:- start:347 stop:1252 length:906 start_codon:yes stop_codon:yes gene_type:complete
MYLLHSERIPKTEYLPYFSVLDSTWPRILVGLGVAHPYCWHTRQGWMKQYKKKQRAIRLRLLSSGQMGEEALSQTFGVAQAEYPEAVFKGFGLEDPPTPYELACFLFTWALPKGSRGEETEGRSALLWWLAGIGAEAIEKISPGWEPKAGAYIRRLMETPMFAVWALGTDMRPAIKSPIEARALLSFGSRRDYRIVEAFKSMRKSVYINSHISSGKRGRGVERWLPEFRPLWHTLDERIDWEEDGKWAPRLAGVRIEAGKLLGKWPGWVPEKREDRVLRDSDLEGVRIMENPHPQLPWRTL